MFVFMSLVCSLRYASCKSSQSLVEIGKQPQGLWWAVTKEGELHSLKILPHTVVTSLLICFHAKNAQNKHFKSLIFSWELNQACFRRLSVALRIH
ncbi:MAG: hypothetical protein K0R66_279 [Gammaproteobacteria bacterium]|jgi:hypothetical protein|nr:hypothetical protein [Gammaproteobacteria bacterium]